jgi:hypothetical protein
MTKKHFELAAKMVRDMRLDKESARRFSTRKDFERALMLSAAGFETLFAEGNPRFDHARFLAACGFD